MNILEEYKNSSNKFNFLNSEIESSLNQVAEFKKYIKYDSIQSYFNNIKKINYLKFRINNILKLIAKYKNDNIYTIHSEEYTQLNSYENRVLEFLSLQVDTDKLKSYSVDASMLSDIFSIFNSAFVENDNLIIDEYVEYMNFILNNIEDTTLECIINNQNEELKNRLLRCNATKILNSNNNNIVLQDYDLQKIHIDIKPSDLLKLVNDISLHSVKGVSKHGGVESDIYNKDIDHIIPLLKNIIQNDITILVLYNSLRDVNYISYNKLNIKPSYNYVNSDILKSTNNIVLKQNSEYSTNKHYIYSSMSNFDDELKCDSSKMIILETYNNKHFNILSNNSDILLEYSNFKSLISKLRGVVNVLSERIICYNKAINKKLYDNILKDNNIQEYYTFIEQKIIESKEKNFKQMIDLMKLDINYNDTFETIKSKIKKRLYEFFVDQFQITDIEILIILKSLIKSTILNIKKDYLDDRSQIYTSISYVVSKPNNIFDSMIEILSYDKYYFYLKEFL